MSDEQKFTQLVYLDTGEIFEADDDGFANGAAMVAVMADDLGTVRADEYGNLFAAAPELFEALRRIEAAGQAVLRAMDKHNEKHGTFLGGPPFFELGRSCAAALSALTKASAS